MKISTFSTFKNEQFPWRLYAEIWRVGFFVRFFILMAPKHPPAPPLSNAGSAGGTLANAQCNLFCVTCYHRQIAIFCKGKLMSHVWTVKYTYQIKTDKNWINIDLHAFSGMYIFFGQFQNTAVHISLTIACFHF